MFNFIEDYWKSLVVGIVGAALFIGAYHLYVDHQNFHTLINLIQQQSVAKQSIPLTPTK